MPAWMISQHLSYTTHFPDLTHEHVMLTLIESTHLIQMPLIIALFHKKLQHPLIQSGYGTGKYIIDPSVGLQKALRQWVSLYWKTHSFPADNWYGWQAQWIWKRFQDRSHSRSGHFPAGKEWVFQYNETHCRNHLQSDICPASLLPSAAAPAAAW